MVVSVVCTYCRTVYSVCVHPRLLYVRLGTSEAVIIIMTEKVTNCSFCECFKPGSYPNIHLDRATFLCSEQMDPGRHLLTVTIRISQLTGET